MEFIPTTISGIAHRRYCFTSMIQENAARKKKQTPPLKSVQLGVQMRLTMGQIPVTWRSRAAAASTAPAIKKRLMGILGAAERNDSPARRPRRMVPIVGIKLRVR